MNGFSKSGCPELDEKINEWFTLNKNKKLEEETKSLLQECSEKELKNIFLKRIEFGTAGLRGKMGPGFAQMNDLVVIQTAQGLLRYLKSLNIHKKGLVLGYDGRHNSRRFAELTAGIFLREGVKVLLPNEVCPTPYVPFAVKKYSAAAGVMVTASHNPKEDNGYKVYWTNGAQIIPPHDKLISRSIEENLTPREEYWDTSILRESSELLVDYLDELQADYNDIIREELFKPEANAAFLTRFTYTAMHGVGYPYIKSAFSAAHFKEVIPVKEQVEPDPDFPTVEFPNPEEGQSALTLSFRCADLAGSPIILANDPDADRLAVAEKLTDGTWKVFNGNELGGLLAWWLIHIYKDKHPEQEDLSHLYLLSSTVSSKIAKTIATKEGCSFQETLTGFKWMGNRTEELLKEGNKKVLFAFEEAIGFMCGSAVPDKDGISAAVRVAELAVFLYGQSMSLTDKLEDIYRQYGYHMSDNSYFFCHEPSSVVAMFNDLRTINNKENSYPESLLSGKYPVSGIRDLTTGYDSSQPDLKAVLPTSRSSQMITFTFQNGLVATLRTSGTEPKIKYYTELCASPHIKDPSEVKKTLSEMVEALINEFIQPEKYGFTPRKV